jgi:triosephosphate isomerase
MRKKIIAGNWKMNLSIAEGSQLVNEITATLSALPDHKEVVFAPPFLHCTTLVQQLQGKNNIYVAAQNCSSFVQGAYTGEVAASMISNAGIQYVIIGHSERRSYFLETEALLADKVNQALAAGLRVIFCCGEPLTIREAGTQNEFVADQIKASLFHLEADAFKHIVIAYEPIWAIGTGLTASSQQAQNMHAHIRSSINAQYGANIANELSILYGGSCKASNAAELFACEDVDGGLIGGASLVANDFVGIINAMP